MIVYTCLVGEIDVLKDPLFPHKEYKYICFSDRARDVSVWKIEPLIKSFDCPRLCARYHKTIGASLLNDDTLWQDAKLTFRSKIDFIQNQTLCLAKHPIRDCIYDEANKVVELGKDNVFNTDNLITKYKFDKYPRHNGLYETSLVYRNNCESNKLMNSLWWDEIQVCVRDQISLPYILWKHGQKASLFNFDVFNNRYFEIAHHSTNKKVKFI